MSDSITYLHNITPQQLGEIISENVKTQLEELKRELQLKETDIYFTRNEVAEMLKIDLSTLYNWTKQGKLKSVGISGRVYYRKQDIDQALIKIN
ncbi:MAG: helix-turn-helix domain-containing protein [Flavobacteriaceae bacterium]